MLFLCLLNWSKLQKNASTIVLDTIPFSSRILPVGTSGPHFINYPPYLLSRTPADNCTIEIPELRRAHLIICRATRTPAGAGAPMIKFDTRLRGRVKLRVGW